MSYHHQHNSSAGPSRLHGKFQLRVALVFFKHYYHHRFTSTYPQTLDEKWFSLGGEHNINDTAPSKRDAGHGHGHGSGTSSKRRKDISGKLGKEMSDRRDE
jgi:hypothetical protein